MCLIELILKLSIENRPYNVVLVDNEKLPVNLLLNPSSRIPLLLYLKIHPSYRLIRGFNVNQPKNK
jgi:hypothetical protein